MIEKMDKIKIRQATKQGYKEVVRGGICDMSFPTSTTKRGRVQGEGKICPTIMAESRLCKVEDGYRIRRLTPRECFRLMGFTDEDFDKASKVTTEKNLYKQAGNSIVVQVLEAVFKQLIGEEVK